MRDDYNPPVDPFGTDRMTDALKAFCREQGMDAPQLSIRIGILILMVVVSCLTLLCFICLERIAGILRRE